ncbi:hypothetical protein G6F37_007079 [Rhizopus arrhizus]|nr:hypothetical protein G6F38_007264 [Rhizopus arrhizus]KAG1157022.1 hypothetical protein G6F37_007079 [Rhizopus arrhizus]
MDDNESKWEFVAPKFWDFTNRLPQELPPDSWFSERTISGPSFPVHSPPFSRLKKRRPTQSEPSESSATKKIPTKKQRLNDDVFSRLSSTTTVSSASKSTLFKSTRDQPVMNRAKNLLNMQANKRSNASKNPLLLSKEPQATTLRDNRPLIHPLPKPSQTDSTLHEPIQNKSASSSASHYIPKTPPEQIRTSWFAPYTPPPPSPEPPNTNIVSGSSKSLLENSLESNSKDGKSLSYFGALHVKHKQIIDDLRERIKKSIQEALNKQSNVLL